MGVNKGGQNVAAFVCILPVGCAAVKTRMHGHTASSVREQQQCYTFFHTPRKAEENFEESNTVAVTNSEKSESWPGLDCIHTSQLEKQQSLTPQNKLMCKSYFNILLWTTAFYFKNPSQLQNLQRLKNLRVEVSQQQADERVTSLAPLMHTVEKKYTTAL